MMMQEDSDAQSSGSSPLAPHALAPAFLFVHRVVPVRRKGLRQSQVLQGASTRAAGV